MRPTYAVVAVAALMIIAVAAVPLLAAPLVNVGSNSQQSAMPANDNFDMTSANQSVSRMSQQSLVQMFQNLTDKDPLFGAFNNANGNITGRYVSFTVNPSNGTLTDYNMNVSGKQASVFKSVAIASFKPTTWNVSGPLFTETSKNFTVFAHDNPMGSLHAAATDGGSINLSTANGISVAPLTSANLAVKAWNVTGNGVNGVLVVYNGSVNSSFGKSTTGVPGGNFVNVSLQRDGMVLFQAIPVAGGFPRANEDFLASQLANLSVEGGLSLMTVRGTTFWIAVENGMRMPSVNVTSSSVIVNLTAPATGGLLPLIGSSNVSNVNVSQGGAPAWYVISMDKNTLDPANGSLQVMVNGQQLTAASSVSQLIGSNGSVYWMYNGTNASRLVVPLPSGSGSVSIVIQQSKASAGGASAGMMPSGSYGLAARPY